MDILSKATVHCLVIKYQEGGNIRDKSSSSDKTADITAVPFSSSASAATTVSYVVVRVAF
jgi:hypothetical protein